MNGNSTVKYLGVTPPVTTSPSTPTEIAATEALLETLKAEGLFESEESSRNREIVLGKIDKLVQEFVYLASLKHGLSEAVARDCKGKIFTSGSYRLGVHIAGADIDTICVTPAHVKRDDFFDIMFELLKARSEVGELTPVHEAFVPVIKMQFSGVDIDLTFASLQLPTIPEDLELLDTNLLRNLDDVSIRSVNGSRVTDEILRLVPNIPNFRLALRCIKLWAKRRAVYSNAMGFLGGVAWAMLVARVCQLYPNACAGAIIARFFRIMFNWKWPSPVLLKPIEDGPLHARVWNPKIYAQDEAHKMPIITPAYPSMCSTHNVSTSTKTIIMAEFRRGAEIVDKIMLGKAKWDELLEKGDFFYRYKHYLQVNVSSEDDEAHHRLHGLVNARIRHFVMKLEAVDLVVLAHPYIKSFDHDFAYTSDEQMKQIREGSFPSPSSPPNTESGTPGVETKGSSDSKGSGMSAASGSDATEKTTEESTAAATSESKDKERRIYTSAFYIGLLIKEKQIGAAGKRRMDLSWPTQEYIKLIKQPDLWDEETMSISVRFLRQRQLPDEVFGGQPRERKHKAQKKQSKNEAKRQQPNTNGPDHQAKKPKVSNTPVPSTSGTAGAKQQQATSSSNSDQVPGSDTANGKGNDNDSGNAAQPTGQSDSVPSQSRSEQQTVSNTSQDAAAKSHTTKATVTANVPAPVPPPAKAGGIKLKLAGSS
ncbi:polynucleotide adenylyltransferase [Dipsacomyces acuminosporus]|nr:polynucleotide adenylyltransferase [Dipsacomyces acuminosporus]